MDKRINRRTALRNLLIIAGGAMVLPACYRQSGSATVALNNLDISEADENLLAELVEALIPATDTPGGKELLLHLFVLKMVDDCHSPEDQQAFSAGLNAFAKWAPNELGSSFADADPAKKEALLQSVQDGNAPDESIGKFYGITKRRAIQGYMNSEYVMTNLVKYELVPGRYDGYAKA
ncbi:gluconate 2-dehydrogenase subunit 3 family protein [Parapedobacter tibetensis]|uniref:gluconate 2-dehydrogenase subunit 3 family protein n=1 Tax=Parapedobacter tibetensis TaxID=2972951 RepID=UPI00214DAE53|nr:gluconate 2-dehydrogenase subunit 3 family protein [Parapedobacter tibetensis]